MKLFPWSGFLYELRRALLSVPLLVITIVLILASFAILAAIAESRPAPTNFLETSGAYYYSNGDYHFEVFVYDQYGKPISKANVSVDVYQSNFTFGPQGPLVASVSGLTGTSGLVQLAAPLNETNYTADASASAAGWIPEFGPGQTVPVTQPPAPYMVEPFIRGFTNVVQSGPGIRQSNLLQVFYPGPNWTAPPDYQVYWATTDFVMYPPAAMNESAMHRLGTLRSVDQIFSLTVPGSSSSSPGEGILQVELFTTSGHLVAIDTNQSSSSFLPPPGGTAGISVAFAFGSTIFVFLVPLMAILAAYSVYGRDRLTGVLEGVLARPVSRLGIATSRYLAVVAALCLAVLAALACLDALIAWVYGGFLPLEVALVLFASFGVEIGAFTGITFLLSHGLRTVGALVGTALGLFGLFTLGWIIIPNIIGGLTGTIFTPGYELTILQLQFLNPVQFLGLATELFFASVSGVGTSSNPANYGITLASVIFTGLVWTIAPAIALFYVVRHHD
jgi:ABC-type transport system involved in multi-copper enzyme maturation permease subunit